jgi:hypothetical protein
MGVARPLSPLRFRRQTDTLPRVTQVYQRSLSEDSARDWHRLLRPLAFPDPGYLAAQPLHSNAESTSMHHTLFPPSLFETRYIDDKNSYIKKRRQTFLRDFPSSLPKEPSKTLSRVHCLTHSDSGYAPYSTRPVQVSNVTPLHMNHEGSCY